MAIWGSREPVGRKPVAPSRTAIVADDRIAQREVNAAASTLRGYIDQIEPKGVTGWACDMRDLDAGVAIEALASDGSVVVTIADMHRSDVKEAGFGNGNHGFRIDTQAMTGTLLIRFFESKLPITMDPIALDPRGALLSNVMPQTYTDAMMLLATKVRLAHAALVDSAG